jgi:adenylate cyclase class 2
VNQEFETQVLDVDVEAISKKLRDAGAREEDEVLQKRWVYYIDEKSWIRLREVSGVAAITYKNKAGKGISETEELETIVENFEKTAEILARLDFYDNKYYQENRRKKFVIDNTEYTLDSWPKIPTILEIEAKSEEEVHKGLELLGLTGKDVGHSGLMAIYEHYGIDIHSFPELKF